MDTVFDLLIVGGGINGAGIARDAAGRGLTVMLCEKGDLASATSSASSKLIHGGLRYLEHYEFRLVREALGEREVLLRAAPHIIWPLRFVLPYDDGMRPFWLLRCGLFLYDHLGGRKILPPTRVVDLRHDAVGTPLVERFQAGFEYSDCWVDDARLVVLNAVDAARLGAVIATRTCVRDARRIDDVWQVTTERPDGTIAEVRAAALINAAGPWVHQVRSTTSAAGDAGISEGAVRLVKGSHIVVPRLHDGSQAYTFQNKDGRVVFVIPYEGAYSLIGTTDVAYAGDVDQITASVDESAYLCAAVAPYFKKGPHPDDIVWRYAGVRPLYDDGKTDVSAVTRDYKLVLDAPTNEAPMLTIYGGKITTYRCLAEEALDQVLPALRSTNGASTKRANGGWTKRASLPGGDIPDADFARFLDGIFRRFPFLPPAMATRLARAYGTRMTDIIGNSRTLGDLGQLFGGTLSEAELTYLRHQEWASSAEDVLWRRSKLGLHGGSALENQVADWFARP